MLSNQHYYHRTVRKLVVAFGSIFNTLRLVRYNAEGTVEIERINVPLVYASKEKFYMRIAKDPDLLNPVQLTLPRMSFEMNGLTYDPLRKISSFTDTYSENGPDAIKKVKLTPYNFDFNLYAFVRNTEDGMQIIEQILPYFNPDYTVTLDFLSLDGLKLDVPIVFNSISYDDSHEGDPESTRSIVWTLNFTMKGYLFGGISDNKIIKKATANVYNSNYETTGKGLYLTNGLGDYKSGELVYQGGTLDEAVSTAYVSSWNATANHLVLYGVNGQLVSNNKITGVVSGAKYTVDEFATVPSQFVKITVLPDPPTANATDDFGFTTTIEEFY